MTKHFRLYVTLLVLLLLGAVASPRSFAQNTRRLDEAFGRVDTNSDGKLTSEEVSRFSRLERRLEGADRNGDGFISIDEFKQQLAGAARGRVASTGRLSLGVSLRGVRVGDVERRYLAYLPKSYDDAKPTPVVIAFHGGGGNPESMIRLSGLNEKSEQAGFIVAYPYGSGRDPDRGLTFNGGGCCGYAHRRKIDDIEFVRRLLEDLQGAANVDANRVYATGFSNGAIMTYYVASELSDLFAAVAPVSGTMMTDSCNPQRPVPVIHFHGTADKLAPFNGGKGEGTSGVPALFRPEFNSVDHSIQNWVKANGCGGEPTVEALPSTTGDGMSVTRKAWSDGTAGAEVVLVEIKDGGHTWPGKKPVSEILGASTMTISANDLMWQFFQKHARK